MRCLFSGEIVGIRWIGEEGKYAGIRMLGHLLIAYHAKGQPSIAMPKTRSIMELCYMGIRGNNFVCQVDVFKGSNGRNEKFRDRLWPRR